VAEVVEPTLELDRRARGTRHASTAASSRQEAGELCAGTEAFEVRCAVLSIVLLSLHTVSNVMMHRVFSLLRSSGIVCTYE
jgi:hypothetical protein